MNSNISYLLLETREAQETIDGAIPFSLCHQSESCDQWVTMPSEHEILIHAPLGFCVYFSAVFENYHTSCALWINDHEIPATRCLGALFGSAITIPTMEPGMCRIALRLTNRQKATVTTAKILVFRL